MCSSIGEHPVFEASVKIRIRDLWGAEILLVACFVDWTTTPPVVSFSESRGLENSEALETCNKLLRYHKKASCVSCQPDCLL